MSQFDPTDLFLVNRGGTSYKVPFSVLQESLVGGGIADPTPIDVEPYPWPGGGAGTETDPFIVTPKDCFLSGDVFSDEAITIVNQPDGSRLVFEDLNEAENGFNYYQDPITFDKTGQASFRLRFRDLAKDSKNYTGLIKAGQVHFQWGVTVLTKGIEPPVIEEIATLSGVTAAPPPTSPLYQTESFVGACSPRNRDISGLTPSTETAPLDLIASTGSGVDAKAIIYTDAAGEISAVKIDEGGVGYAWEDTVIIDLSSLGGSSTENFIVYTAPCTGATAILTVTPFQSINAGGFAEAKFEVSDSPDFTNILSSYNATSNVTTYSVPLNVPPNTPYYIRMRYVSSDSVESTWTPIVRSATGNQLNLRYVWKNMGKSASGFNSNSFDSGEFVVAFRSYTYIMTICNGGLGLGGQQNCNYGTNPGGRAASARGAVYLLLRQPVNFRITSVFGDGGVSAIERISPAYGLPKSYDWNDGGSLTLNATTNSAAGAGVKVQLQKDTDGSTNFNAIQTPGSGYEVNDILTVTPPTGNPRGNANDELDEEHDVMLHGLGGGNSGGWRGNGIKAGGSGGGGGGASTYSIYAKNGGNGGASGGPRNACGSGGSAGWAGGGGGYGNGGNAGYNASGGGGGSFYDADMLVNAAEIPTDFGSVSCEVFVNGTSIADSANTATIRLI